MQYIYIQQCSSNKRYNVSYCCCVTVRGLWIAQAVLVALGFGRVALVAWGLVWLPLGMGGLPWLPGGVGGLPVTQSIKLHRPGAPPKMDPVSDWGTQDMATTTPSQLNLWTNKIFRKNGPNGYFIGSLEEQRHAPPTKMLWPLDAHIKCHSGEFNHHPAFLLKDLGKFKKFGKRAPILPP